MFKPRAYLLLLLVAFAVLVKVFPYIWMQFNIEVDPRYSLYLPWNFAPLMAITLFAGAYFRNSVWGPLLPLIILATGDLGVYLISGKPEWALYLAQGYIYGTMLFCGLLSLLLRNREQFFAKGLAVVGVGFVAETIFFLVTNAGIWRCSFLSPAAGYKIYDQTFAGLMEVYAAGFPFYVRSLISTTIYGTALFYGYRVYATAAIRELQPQTQQVVDAA